MKKLNRVQKHTIWFARWTKTPWAVFNSLCRVVHIQYMNITAFKRSLLQQHGVICDELALLLMLESSAVDDDELPDESDSILDLNLQTPNEMKEIAATSRVVALNYISYYIPIYMLNYCR